MIKAVIFDVDGTRVDSNDLHGQMGKGGDQLMPVLCTRGELDSFGEEPERGHIELFESDYLPRVRPFPRVRELFERIKADGLPLAKGGAGAAQGQRA